MSKINYRRKEWKIKIRKPVSIRPTKPMESNRYERHRERQALHEILKEVAHEANKK